jgi:hypothetical protein
MKSVRQNIVHLLLKCVDVFSVPIGLLVSIATVYCLFPAAVWLDARFGSSITQEYDVLVAIGLFLFSVAVYTAIIRKFQRYRWESIADKVTCLLCDGDGLSFRSKTDDTAYVCQDCGYDSEHVYQPEIVESLERYAEFKHAAYLIEEGSVAMNNAVIAAGLDFIDSNQLEDKSTLAGEGYRMIVSGLRDLQEFSEDNAYLWEMVSFDETLFYPELGDNMVMDFFSLTRYKQAAKEAKELTAEVRRLLGLLRHQIIELQAA